MSSSKPNEQSNQKTPLEKPLEQGGQSQTTTPPDETPTRIIRFKRPEPFRMGSFKNKKFISLSLLLIMIILGGITIATAWRLRQAEKVTPEEAEAAGCGGHGHFRMTGEVYCQDQGGPKIPIPGVKIGRIIEDCFSKDNCVPDSRVSQTHICTNWTVTYAAQTDSSGRWVSDARLVDAPEIPENSVRVWTFKIAEIPPTYIDANGIERSTSQLVGPVAENCGNTNVCETPAVPGFGSNFCSSGNDFYSNCSFDPTAGGRAQRDGHKCYRFDNSSQECSTAVSTGNPDLDQLYSKDPCTDLITTNITNCYWPFLGTTESLTPPMNFKFTNCSAQPTPTPTSTLTPTPTPTNTPTPTATPTPTPTNTPTPTPTVTPTPTPTPPTLCLDLTSTAEGSVLQQGQEVTFTCIGSSGIDNPIDHVEFQVQINGGTWVPIGIDAASRMPDGTYQGSVNYTVPSTGVYRFECRVCTTSYCTTWGKAQ